MNIVEMIFKILSGDTLKKLAASIGESPESVQKALAAIVPTLLSGIGALATKPEGGEKLWNSLKTVDDKVADDLGGVLERGGEDELAKKGTNILEDLMGKGGLMALVGPIASFLASNPALVKKLIPLVAPLILSVLGKQVKAGGLDLGGLLKMILAQKGNIAKAMPAGLTNSLAGVQGLGDLSGFVSGASQALSSAGDKAVAHAKESTQWLVPLIALAALLAAGVWWMNNNQAKPPVGADHNVIGEPAPMNGDALKDAVSPASALSKSFSALLDGVNETLGSVTDVPTAEAAVPKLKAFDSQVDDLTALFNKLPDEAKSSVTALLEQGQKSVQEKAEKVLAIPGVGELLKPLLDGILEKISALLKS